MNRAVKSLNVCFKRYFCKTYTEDKVNIIGRHLLHPLSYTEEEYMSLIWTALDIKQRFKANGGKPLPKESSLNIENRRVTLLLHHPCLHTQLTTANAAKLLHTNVNCVTYPNWPSMKSDDFGHMLGLVSDIVLIDSPEQNKLEELSKTSNAPVVILKSCQQMVLQALTDIMTAYIHFGSLKDRTLALIGEPSSLFNSYLIIAPMFGINVKYLTLNLTTGEKPMPMSPIALKEGKEVEKNHNVQVNECETAKQVLTDVHMIATNHDNVKNILTSDEFKYAAPDHVFLHCMRKWCEVFIRGPHVDTSPKYKDLHWKTIYNYQWMVTAIIIRLIKEHKHEIPKPKF